MTKSVTIEHAKTSRILSNTIRQAKKASQVGSAGKNSTSPLYSKTTKTEKSFDEKKTIKKAKIMKWSQVTQVLIMLKLWILLILNYSLKIFNLQLEIN